MGRATTYRNAHTLEGRAPATAEQPLAEHRGTELCTYVHREPPAGRNTAHRKALMQEALLLSLHRVDIIIYPGFRSLDAFEALSVFSQANRQLQRRGNPKRYEVEVVSLTGGMVFSDIGVALQSTRALSWNYLPHTAVLVGADDIETVLRDGRDIVDWCVWAAQHVRRIATLYSACFFLAEAGLLDGLKATTHWSVVDLLRRKYPQIQVEEDAIFTSTNNLWTSAGAATTVDLALAFVEQDCGRQIALDVAREMVVFTKRSGGQSQCSASLVSQLAGSASMRDLQNWILERLDSKVSVEEMASYAGLSVRHFARTFRSNTGLTASQFVEQSRIDKALGLLEDSNLPLKTIAFHCGFASDQQMRKVFKKRLSITPHEYRRGRRHMRSNFLL